MQEEMEAQVRATTYLPTTCHYLLPPTTYYYLLLPTTYDYLLLPTTYY